MPMTVLVTEANLPHGASVGTATGDEVFLDEDWVRQYSQPANTVTFGVDHRMLRHILAVLEKDGEISCYVEDWQILHTTAKES